MSWRSRSYDVLPALSVRGPELRNSLRTVTAAWSFGIVWAVCCTSGSHVQLFCRQIGFGDFAFGVLAAIPFIASFGQVLASVIVDRTGLRKFQFVQCATMHRAGWLLVAAVPLVFGSGPTAVAMALVVLSLSWFANSLAAPAWFTWMGDLIPRRIRGRYFAQRERLTLMVQIVVVVALGIVFDALTVRDPVTGKEAAAQPAVLTAAMIVTAAGAMFGMVDILLFRRIREVVPPRPPSREPIVRFDPGPATSVAAAAFRPVHYAFAATRQLLLDPLSDRVFRHFVLFGATMSFSATVGMWYFWSMALEDLRFSKLATNMLFQVIGPVASIMAAPLWGRAIDRWGRRPVLMLATCICVGSIVPWFFAMPGMAGPAWLGGAYNWVCQGAAGLAGHTIAPPLGADAPTGAYLLCAIGCVIGGASWTGIGIAQFNVMLGFSDGSGRSKFVAASSVLVSLGGLLGGLAGGAIARSLAFLHDNPITLGIFQWNNFHATMLACVLARILAAFWLVGMPEPGSRSVRDVMRYMRLNVQNAVSNWLFYPLRVFGYGKEVSSDENADAPRRRDGGRPT